MTGQQRAALAYLASADRDVSPRELADVLRTSPEGAARTASSLVAAGVATRLRLAGGRSFYRAAPTKESTP